MLLPAVWLPDLPLTGDEIVRVRQGGAWVYPKLSDVVALSQVQVAAALSPTNAAIVALTQRVAALEGKPDPCVALSGTLAPATLQIGTTDVQVAVPGLLSTDRIAVEVMADLPTGLTLGAMRPSPTAPGVLLVQAIASLALVGKAPIPLAVTALR